MKRLIWTVVVCLVGGVLSGQEILSHRYKIRGGELILPHGAYGTGGMPVSLRVFPDSTFSGTPLVLAPGIDWYYDANYTLLHVNRSPAGWLEVLFPTGSTVMLPQPAPAPAPAAIAPAPAPVPTVADLLAYAKTKGALITDDPATWSAQRRACAAMTPGSIPGSGSMNGFVPWAPDSAWRQDISTAPVSPSSETWLKSMGSDQGIALKGPIPTGQSDLWGDVRYGMSIHIADATTPKIDVSQALASVPAIAAIDPTAYPDSSDPGPYRIPSPVKVQGTEKATGINYMVGGDKHVFVIDKDLCVMTEFFNTYIVGGQVYAGTIATFDLLGGDLQRPWGWSSTSVSGVPQFAGIVSYEDVARGAVPHAGAFTTLGAWGRAGFVLPAQHHQWNNANNPAMPPFGARLRLKSTFDTSRFGPQSRAILEGLKRYGTFYVDGGLSVDTYYTMDSRWNWLDMAGEPGLYHVLVNPTNFEFVESGPIYSFKWGEQRPPAGLPPTIDRIEAYPPSVSAGQPAIVFWSASGESMRFLTPEVGATRQNFAIVYPKVTTTYTLAAQNRNGRVSKTVTVAVK